MRGRVGLVVADRVDGGHDVLEARGPAELSIRSRRPGSCLLEVVAVAGERPHLRAAEIEGGPAEHRAVEVLRAGHVAGVQPVEVHRAVLVDDPRAAVLVGLPQQKTAPSGSARTAIRPASITSNGSIITAPPASRAFTVVSSAL